MEKNEVMNKIKEVVYKTIGISIEDDNDNILGCHHNYPAIYAIYITDELEKIYGKEIFDIFSENDYTVWKVSNLADAIIKVCNKAAGKRLPA